MPRTAVTPAQLSRNAGAAPTSTTIDSTLVTNGVTIANANPEKLVIRFANTASGGAKNIIIRAGASLYPGVTSGQGDLSVSAAASTGVQRLGPLDSARFLQSDGSLSIDFDSGTTGTLETSYLP